MTETYAYPPEVAAALRRQCPAHGSPLPAPAVLTGFVAVGFQASLLREEDHPVQGNLYLMPAPAPGRHPAPPPAVVAAFQVLAFSEPRAYDAQELRRLSPTTQRPGTLLAVAPAPAGGLVILGLVFATRPWDHADAPYNTALLPPSLFMQVAGPGRLAFFCGPEPVLVLQHGQVGDYGGREFPAGWLSGLTEGPDGGGTATGAPAAAAELRRQLISNNLRRCLARVRGHGGMLVLVPGPDVPRLVGPAGLLRPKYGVQPPAAGEQHHDFGACYRELLQLTLARSLALGLTDWAAYRLVPDGELQQLRTEMEQFADLLADLMAVDGPLVLDHRFTLLGFGVEIAAPAPPPPLVYRALDAEGMQLQDEAADSGGTRHRASLPALPGRGGLPGHRRLARRGHSTRAPADRAGIVLESAYPVNSRVITS